MKYIDRFLNSITMYRLVLYGLSLLALLSIILGYIRKVSFSGTTLIASLAILIASCYAANLALAAIFKAPRNVESSYISAFILFFVLLPATNLNNAIILVAGSIIAMGSKFVFSFGRKHLFNPVAISALILGLAGIGAAIWWVATPWMAIPVALVGLLIVRKIGRFPMFWSFFITAVIVLIIVSLDGTFSVYETLKQSLVSGPILFFGTIMLTEPLTTPPTRKLQIIYGLIIGIIFSSQFELGRIAATPEFALIIGNIFSYIVSPKQKPLLAFKSRKQLSPLIHHFAFASDQKLPYKPGQYLEWTLPHEKPDTRGNRRFFTIASSPTEDEIHLGVRIQDNGSSFKNALLDLKQGDKLVVSSLAGEFTLQDDSQIKLGFIAGGIGITPFRSMIKYSLDKNDKRDIVLFYAAVSENDFVYKDLFKEAEKIGLKTAYVVKDYITEELIKKEAPDYKERTFYLSGPEAMVANYRSLLEKMDMPSSNIMTDYFPGF